MQQLTKLTLAIVIALTLPVAALGENANHFDMQLGRWQLRMYTKRPLYGAPPWAVHSVCISPANPDPLEAITQKGCDTTRMVDGNRLYWKSVCKKISDKVAISSKGVILSRGKTISGRFYRKVVIENPDQTHELILYTVLSGKHKGSCE